MEHFPKLAVLTLLAAFSGVAGHAASEFGAACGLAPLVHLGNDLCPTATAQSLTVLPNINGSEISADGQTLSGSLRGGTPASEAVFWRAGSGYIHTGISALPNGLHPISLSGDGQYLGAGIRADGHAFRSSISGATDVLPLAFPPSGSEVTGISYDGNTLVGFEESLDGFTIASWRWTPQTGLQGLPFMAAWAISGDGSTITGSTVSSQSAVLRNGVVSVLPYVGGAGGPITFGNAINYDGTVIVGMSGNQPAIWVNGVGSLIPPPAGYTGGSANDVSADGTIVLGQAAAPFIWTQATGSVLLTNYFASYGIDLSAYSLSRATVSDDGRTFAVDARNIATQQIATLIVAIPAPAGVGLIGMMGLLACQRRRHPAHLPRPG